MEPMKMLPAYKDYLWGGERLINEYGKATRLRPVAESWEISCHPDGLSTVAEKKFAGRTLAGVLTENPHWIGKYSIRGEDLPVIIKLIDAREPLSLQVHPDDVYANRVEKQHGKNEIWYVVDCEPGSELMIGFKKPLERDEITNAIKDETILESVNRVKIEPGDCYSIPAGLIHAIGGGCLIAEIQQSSNITYRVYDYGRVGPDGKPRELHVEKALDVIDSSIRVKNSGKMTSVMECDGYTEKQLTDWPYFSVRLLEIKTGAELSCGAESFHGLLVVEGNLELLWQGKIMLLRKGESVFVPAGLGPYSLLGKARILITRM